MKAAFVIVYSFFLFCSNSFAQGGDSLRIITYNIHHANPPAKPGAIDVDAFITLFKKYPADVIALQEVDVNTARSGGINEARMIADSLGMYSFFAKTIDHDGGFYGVALLSRFPFKDPQVYSLPMDTTSKGERRVLAFAAITLPSGRSLVVGCTHLDHRRVPKSRQLQIAAIDSIAQKVSHAFIIAGDFNAAPGSSEMKQFDQTFQRTCDACPFTFPAVEPTKTIDFILYKKAKGIGTISHTVLPELLASDHRPVKAVILFQ